MLLPESDKQNFSYLMLNTGISIVLSKQHEKGLQIQKKITLCSGSDSTDLSIEDSLLQKACAMIVDCLLVFAKISLNTWREEHWIPSRVSQAFTMPLAVR